MDCIYRYCYCVRKNYETDRTVWGLMILQIDVYTGFDLGLGAYMKVGGNLSCILSSSLFLSVRLFY
jgi:hypothetical protein